MLRFCSCVSLSKKNESSGGGGGIDISAATATDARTCVTSYSSPRRSRTVTSSRRALQPSEGWGIPPVVKQHMAAGKVSGTPGKRPGVLLGGRKMCAALKVSAKEGFVLLGRQEQGSGGAQVRAESAF